MLFKKWKYLDYPKVRWKTSVEIYDRRVENLKKYSEHTRIYLVKCCHLSNSSENPANLFDIDKIESSQWAHGNKNIILKNDKNGSYHFEMIYLNKIVV